MVFIDLTPKTFIVIPSEEMIQLPEPSAEDMGLNWGGLEVGSNRLAKGQLVILPHLEQILFGDATDPTTGIGIFLGKSGSDYELRMGDPAGNNLHYDGTDVILTGGTISGGSISIGSGDSIFKADSSGIYLGDAIFADAPFSVDPDGNVIANSIKAAKGNFDRDDFHWLTIFESIDGFFKSGTGGVNITLDGDGRGVKLVNNATTSDEQRLYKNLGLWAPTTLTWDKDRKIKFKVKLEEATAQTVFLVTGSVATATERHFGFVIFNNGVLRASVANGTTESTLDFGAAGTGQILLEAHFISGTSVEFFKDGVSLGTITTNLPTGVTDSQFLAWISTITLENVAKTIQVGFWDFWQTSS